MMASLTVTHDTSAGRAAALLAAIYGQYVPELTVTKGDKLEFETSSSSQPSTTLVDTANALLQAAGKTNDALGGASEDVQAQVLDYLKLVDANRFDGEKGVEAADAELTTKTFLVGETVSAADLSLFAALHPTVASATHTQHLSHPSLSRHFDHIQNLRLVTPHLSSVFASTPEPVKIDVKNVPVVEIKQQVKVKNASAAGAAATAAEAPKEAGHKEKAEKAQVVEEVKKEVETVAPIEGTAAATAKPKKEKAEKAKKPAAPAPTAEAPAPWMLDLRVGKIVEVAVHPDADSLYVEKIDVGEDEPRTVVSGLVKYMSLEQMQGATLITVCNLKPANMRGVKSFAMVLCATATEGKEAGIEFLSPPEGSVPGDRVYFEGFEDQQALDILNPKKKIFETVQPGFTTLHDRVGAWVDKESGKAYKIVTKRGECRTKSLVGASLS